MFSASVVIEFFIFFVPYYTNLSID